MIDLIMLHRRPPEMAIPIETNASEIGFNQRKEKLENGYSVHLFGQGYSRFVETAARVLRSAVVDNRLATSRGFDLN